MEMIQVLHYKLFMMGTPIDEPKSKFCDNEAIVRNSYLPEPTLRRNTLVICYHHVCKGCASGIIQIAKDNGATNLADILTKSLPGPELKDLTR